MRAQPRNSRIFERKKEQSKQRNIDAYEGKRALLATWEGLIEPDDEYVRALRRRMKQKENQLKARGL